MLHLFQCPGVPCFYVGFFFFFFLGGVVDWFFSFTLERFKLKSKNENCVNCLLPPKLCLVLRNFSRISGGVTIHDSSNSCNGKCGFLIGSWAWN